MQDALGRWMREQGFERHLRRTTKRYQQRRDHLAAELNALKSKGIELDFTQPAGGMALWVDVKRDAEQLAQYGREHGIYLVAEPFFHLHANNNQNRYIRLGYASMTREQLTEGLAELASFWR